MFNLGPAYNKDMFTDLIGRGDVGLQFNLFFKMSSVEQTWTPTAMDQESTARPANR